MALDEDSLKTDHFFKRKKNNHRKTQEKIVHFLGTRHHQCLVDALKNIWSRNEISVFGNIQIFPGMQKNSSLLCFNNVWATMEVLITEKYDISTIV